MNNSLNIKQITIVFVVITSLTVVSANLISFINFDGDTIEALGDFDQTSSMEYDETDLGEDGDSFFHGISKPGPLLIASEIYTNQYLLYDHFVPGINTPPPEIA